jgi:hypothetical protein
MKTTEDRDPLHHTKKMQKAFQELKDHLLEDVDKVDEPEFKALFKQSAEVIAHLLKAFKNYEEKNETVWRKAGSHVA